MKALFENVAILGTGLIGASLAAAGRRAGALGRVVGVGRTRANLEAALASGCVDAISSDPADAIAGADLVVIAAPVDTSLDLLDLVADHARPGCVVTDVGSVKAPICERAVARGLDARFVGAHPMAGGTETGAAAADADLYRGRVVVLTPGAGTEAGAVSRIHDLWVAVGARVIELDARIHDRVVALSSHLPQMAAFALCATAERSADQALLIELSGNGFRDTTRLARSDHEMWSSIADLNRDALLEAMDRFSSLWAELRGAIARSDGAGVRRIMEQARVYKGKVG
jgi:prephenate dehydrogenase